AEPASAGAPFSTGGVVWAPAGSASTWAEAEGAEGAAAVPVAAVPVAAAPAREDVARAVSRAPEDAGRCSARAVFTGGVAAGRSAGVPWGRAGCSGVGIAAACPPEPSATSGPAEAVV